MNGMKDAMEKAFTPEFAVTIESIGGDNKNGVRILSTVIQNRTKRTYSYLQTENNDPGKMTFLVKSNG